MKGRANTRASSGAVVASGAEGRFEESTESSRGDDSLKRAGNSIDHRAVTDAVESKVAPEEPPHT
ncbi:MAG: hypothetical protein ACYC0H_20005 [Solirubrobacteraceae bacterium]